MMRKVSCCSRSFPLKKAFRISRGAKNSAEVVTVELIEGALWEEVRLCLMQDMVNR